MNDDFDGILVDGAFIRELNILPEKRSYISLLRAPKSTEEEQFALRYDLEFDNLRAFSINLKAEPLLEVIDHKLIADSKLLEDYSKRVQSTEHQLSEMSHFQIICDEGQIDLLAERFTFSLREKIPYYGIIEKTE
jgi:hypothetical protein